MRLKSLLLWPSSSTDPATRPSTSNSIARIGSSDSIANSPFNVDVKASNNINGDAPFQVGGTFPDSQEAAAGLEIDDAALTASLEAMTIGKKRGRSESFYDDYEDPAVEEEADLHDETDDDEFEDAMQSPVRDTPDYETGEDDKVEDKAMQEPQHKKHRFEPEPAPELPLLTAPKLSHKDYRDYDAAKTQWVYPDLILFSYTAATQYVLEQKSMAIKAASKQGIAVTVDIQFNHEVSPSYLYPTAGLKLVPPFVGVQFSDKDLMWHALVPSIKMGDFNLLQSVCGNGIKSLRDAVLIYDNMVEILRLRRSPFRERATELPVNNIQNMEEHRRRFDHALVMACLDQAVLEWFH